MIVNKMPSKLKKLLGTLLQSRSQSYRIYFVLKKSKFVAGLLPQFRSNYFIVTIRIETKFVIFKTISFIGLAPGLD